MKLPLVGPSCSAFAVSAAAQQSLNCYLETIPSPEGKNKFVLRGRPGIALFKDLTAIDAAATPVRGLFSGGGRLFVAAGTKEFEVDSTGALVGSVNTIADDADHSPVQMIPNGNQLLIVSAQIVYCDNGAGPVAVTISNLAGFVTTLNFTVFWAGGDLFDIGMVGRVITIAGNPFTVSYVISPTMLIIATTAGVLGVSAYSCPVTFRGVTGCFLDGYYIVNRPSSRQINISSLLDGTTWSELDFAYKEGATDNIAAVWAEPPFLYLLGTETLEIWRDTGNADFPLERVDGGFAKIGLAATWSPVSIGGRLHMIAGGTLGQPMCVRMDGANPVRVSTPAVEEALTGLTFGGHQGVSWSYFERGHLFWVISIANGNAWVYDATESERLGEPIWHERANYTGGNFAQYQPWFHTFIPEWNGGTHIVGDAANGKLYTMSSATYGDLGQNIRGRRAMSHLWNGGKRMFLSRLEAELETGNATGSPTLYLDYSDDRGHTFGPSPALTIHTSATGEYSKRADVRRLGSFRDRVLRLTFEGQQKMALIDLNADIQMGTR